MYTDGFKVVCDLIRRQAVTYDEAYLLMRDIVRICQMAENGEEKDVNLLND